MPPVKVQVDNRIRVASSLPAEVVTQLCNALTFENPAHKKLIALGYKYNKEPKHISMWSKDRTHLTLPRGAMQTLREVFSVHGLDYEVEDNRTEGDASITGSYDDPWQLQGGCQFPAHRPVLWDHQRGIVDAIKRYEQVLLRSPTGSGKTTGLIGAIAEIGVPSIVIMWDSGLLKQWQERIESELGIPVNEQGLIRGSTCRLRGITLAMQQTLNQWSDARWQQILPVFGLVACDEVQRYAASTFTKAVDRFPAKYRVGVSADERRKDGKQFIIYSMFGPVRHEVEKRTLIQKRLIHEVEVYVFPTEFSAPWYAEKIQGEEDANGEKKKIFAEDFTNLITQMQCDVERNTLAAALVMECVNQNLPTLTFTHRVDHAKILEAMVSAQGVPSGMALGGDDWADEFNRTIEGLRNGSLMVGCGTFGKLGVGHDIPTIAAGVVVTPVHNNQAFFGQVKGRICRTSAGKQNARVIVLWDWKVFGLSPLYSLKKHNEVMRVWDSWNKRWKDVDTFLKEVKHDGRFKAANTSKSAETSDVGGIFGKAR